MSPIFTSRAGLASVPCERMRPRSHAFAASARVLKNRAAHSHLSIRTDEGEAHTRPVYSPLLSWGTQSKTSYCGKLYASHSVMLLGSIHAAARLLTHTKIFAIA